MEDSIISPFQSAFILGCFIHDNVVIAHEVLHSLKTKPKGKVNHWALKIDMVKAYDMVKWCFLKEKGAKKMGFSTKWIQWIVNRITSIV